MKEINNINYQTSKIVNGETVSYSLMSVISILLFVALKQLFKVFIGIPEAYSLIIAFVIAEIVSFLLEKRFVFRKKVLSSNLKQILFFVFRGAVNFGFFKLSQVILGEMLGVFESLYYLVALLLIFIFNYFFDRTLVFDCNYEAQSVKYSRIYKIFYNNRYVIFSALFAAVCLLSLYMIYTVFPFGDHTVMRMDLYHQYGPLFAELYDRILNHGSFIYSWTTGGGSSFFGNFFNYLSSPLTILIFLFDKKDISFAITFLVLVKATLSAGSFAYYLKTSLRGHSFITSVFGVLYAFCAYFLAYYWNIMWLDAMILLPFVVLGIERIIDTGKASTYVISMVILFFSSYYMAYMMCIFAVAYFLVYYAKTSSLTESIEPNKVFDKRFSFKELMNNKFFNRGFKFAVFSLTGAGLCAFSLIPVFIILRSSSATSDSFPTGSEIYFDLFDFITSHFAGLETTIRSSGDDVLPNVYSGILAIILLPLFVINKDIRFKEKVAYIILLIAFVFCFDLNYLNFILHAFHFPNDLPFRFSFMYSFILLVIGYRAISHIKSLEIKDICFVGMAWVLIVVIAQKFSTTKMLETTIFTTLELIIVWTGFLYLLKRNKLRKTILGGIALLICFCEVLICDIQGLTISQKNSNYIANYDNYTEAIETIHSKDNDFYREELTYLETRMDPSYFGYNGMSVFSSMAYEDYSQLQYSLGMFGNRINSYTYNTQTPVYNMMFNIKYLIQAPVSEDLSANLYKHIYTTSDDKTKVYENKYFMPIAYAVNTEIKDWDTSEGNPFDVQADYFEKATGYSDVFTEVDYINTSFDNVKGDDVTNNGTYWFYKSIEDSNYGYADITIAPTQSGSVYLYVNSTDIKSLDYSSNGEHPQTQMLDQQPYILDLGYHDAGEEILISLDIGSMEPSECYADIFAYSLNENVFRSGYNKLIENSLNVTLHSDTSIIGDIYVSDDSYLYTSIPYDEGWSLYIDGEKVNTIKIGDCMLGAQIGKGAHNIELKYSLRGLNYGIIITTATAACLIGYLIISKSKKKHLSLQEYPVKNQ